MKLQIVITVIIQIGNKHIASYTTYWHEKKKLSKRYSYQKELIPINSLVVIFVKHEKRNFEGRLRLWKLSDLHKKHTFRSWQYRLVGHLLQKSDIFTVVAANLDNFLHFHCEVEKWLAATKHLHRRYRTQSLCFPDRILADYITSAVWSNILYILAVIAYRHR